MGEFQEYRGRIRKAEDVNNSENVYKALFDSIPHKMFYKDRSSVYVLCNKNYAEDLGIASEQIKGKTDYDFFPKEIADKYREDDRRLMNSGKAAEFEESYIKNGNKMVIRTFKSPIKDGAGNVAGIFGIFWEVGAQKQIECELRESERKYIELIDNLRIGIYRNTPGTEGRFLEVNDTIVDMLEAGSKEELLKHSVSEFYADPAKRKEFSDKILKMGFLKDEEVELKTLKGREFVALHTTVMKKNDKGEIYFDGLISDITRKKEIERAQAMLAAIVDSSDDAIIGKTLGGMIVSWNEGAVRMYGYTAAEMIGKPISILVPKDRPNEIPEILKKVKSGAHIEHFNTLRLCKDGRPIDVSLTVSPIRDKGGKVVGASTIARDITGQRKLQEELNRKMRDLEKFNKVAVGRELKMIELKKRVAVLEDEIRKVKP
jgi:PAS domain S-box-containing protein